MNLELLKQALSEPDIKGLEVNIENGRSLEPHFHITEVGKVTRDFVDCGGVHRTSETCQLQTLVATDTEHRLAPAKLLGILKKASVLQLNGQVEIELEVQGDTVETYCLTDAKSENGKLKLVLAAKQTACLAPDKCGLEVVPLGTQSCCGDGGC